VERFDGHKVFFSITKEDAQNYRKDWILHKSLFFLICDFMTLGRGPLQKILINWTRSILSLRIIFLTLSFHEICG
jgi:hypothetical protein